MDGTDPFLSARRVAWQRLHPLSRFMSKLQQFDETIPSDLQEAGRVQDRIVALLESLEFSMRDVFGTRLALEEALVNAVKHGNGLDPDKSVQIHCEAEPGRIKVTIEDQGPGFDPATIPDPTAEENLDKPGGRGIMLIRNFMTTVRSEGRGNRLVMEKVIEG